MPNFSLTTSFLLHFWFLVVFGLQSSVGSFNVHSQWNFLKNKFLRFAFLARFIHLKRILLHFPIDISILSINANNGQLIEVRRGPAYLSNCNRKGSGLAVKVHIVCFLSSKWKWKYTLFVPSKWKYTYLFLFSSSPHSPLHPPKKKKTCTIYNCIIILYPVTLKRR